MNMLYSTLYSIIWVIFANLIQVTHLLCPDAIALTEKGVYLGNDLLLETEESSIIECASICKVHKMCRSFGFEPSSRICHLHSHSNHKYLHLVNQTGWFHGDIDDWSKEFLGLCSSVQCPKEERCVFRTNQMKAICEKVSLDHPEDMCSGPPTIPNADVTAGEQRIGSNRSYTCHHGYFDMNSDTTMATITCQTGRVWSKVNLTCDGPYVRVETTKDRKYIVYPIADDTLLRMTGNTSSLLFLSKTCRDCNFVLHDQPDYENSSGLYELSIGGWRNSKSVIRECFNCEIISQLKERDLLSCTEFRPFWVSWADEVVRVGIGHVVGKGMFMKTSNLTPFVIRYVGYSSHVDNKGVWLFKLQA